MFTIHPEGCFWKSLGSILVSDHPILQGMPFHVKVDADLHHGQAAQGEAFGIVLQVDLLYGSLGGLVQL